MIRKVGVADENSTLKEEHIQSHCDKKSRKKIMLLKRVWKADGNRKEGHTFMNVFMYNAVYLHACIYPSCTLWPVEARRGYQIPWSWS